MPVGIERHNLAIKHDRVGLQPFGCGFNVSIVKDLVIARPQLTCVPFLIIGRDNRRT
jgi:hypothetical protein